MPAWKCLWIVMAAGLGIAGCTGSNMTSCKADSDCGSAGKYCVSYTCVQCRSEDDCSLPLVCGQDHACRSLTASY